MGNRSLDDFLGESDDDGAETDSGSDETVPESTPTDSGDEEADIDAPGAVEPAVSTYVWSTSGGECAACEATVERRWRQDEALVCPDCKEW